MNITINKTKYEIKSTIRAMIVYENIMGETFQPSSLSNILVYFYSVIVACNKDCSLGYEEFLNAIDDDVTILNKFTQWLQGTDKVVAKAKKE